MKVSPPLGGISSEMPNAPDYFHSWGRAQLEAQEGFLTVSCYQTKKHWVQCFLSYILADTKKN